MKPRSSAAAVLAVACVSLVSIGVIALEAQRAGQSGRGGGGRGGVAGALFTAMDTNKDGWLTRDEMKASFDLWFTQGDSARSGTLTEAQLVAALDGAMPAPASRGPQVQNRVPKQSDVDAMMAVLPATAPAKPKRPRKVLVLCKAQGYVHSSIPLAAKMVEALGTKTSAWSTVITYDPADINTQNLKQYDLIFLDSTTGLFLDDPNDAAATAARRKALLDFVRGGKGLAGIHAATDSYHGVPGTTVSASTAGGRGGANALLATQIMEQADTNHTGKISRQQLDGLAGKWFDALDTDKAGKLSEADFARHFASLMPRPAPPGPQANEPLWPEFNHMIGGYFKFHWVYPQLITVKIDDPNSPLTAMFHGQEYQIHDETYTFAQDSFSRKNVHVLTSIDYSKMSDADKAKETNKRTDGDYALSYIRREGKGRVFYEAHGHSETVYAIGPFLEHMLAGIQYALGDLKADDSPSEK
ncbi:MAG TPA: ThuA domain-containing protein [Bryobacteraceae bacterium]|nr:ThuA domain-containing protein [Bryobacteraceae bacterium]